MKTRLGNQDIADFLANYWQKKPCIIRGAFLNFDSPLDANDLAGLACDPMAESRIIKGPDQNNQWTLEHGPFEDGAFSTIGDRDWTLLVQDVEKHYAPMQEILAPFSFVPGWRLDDLMVSFAATNGSVGAHVDQYDVFLLQLEGTRHWGIAETYDPTLREDTPVNMLQSFVAEQQYELNAGDLLYLPPNVAHHGVALEPCLTASIGFRAPSKADLFLAYGEWLADKEHQGGRYVDSTLSGEPVPGEIDSAAICGFADLMRIDSDPGFSEFIGQFMSRFRMAHEPAIPKKMMTQEQVSRALNHGERLVRHPWSRFNWIRENDMAVLFASGIRVRCSEPLAKTLCSDAMDMTTSLSLDERDLLALLDLINAGQLVLEQAN